MTLLKNPMKSNDILFTRDTPKTQRHKVRNKRTRNSSCEGSTQSVGARLGSSVPPIGGMKSVSRTGVSPVVRGHCRRPRACISEPQNPSRSHGPCYHCLQKMRTTMGGVLYVI